MTSKYELLRDLAEPIEHKDVSPRLRPLIKERINPSNRVQFFIAGGTPLSIVKDGVRTGGVKFRSHSFLYDQLPEYVDRISPASTIIYDGLSEDITIPILDDMEIDVVRAMNMHLDTITFLMFVGSDMGEVIGSSLDYGLSTELAETGIRLFLIWANNPIPDPQTIHHIQQALRAADERSKSGRYKYPGEVYMVSGNNVFLTELAQKHTWNPSDPGMIYYNAKDEAATTEEFKRRGEVFRFSEELVSHFLSEQTIYSLIEKMDPERFEKPHLGAQKLSPGKWLVSELLSQKGREAQKGELLYHLSMDPADHPRDETGKVLTVHANLLAEVPDYKYFEEAQAVLFILNHSATTSRSNARKIVSICQKRIDEGRPLAAFAVTENGEPRSWDPETGIYPSGTILRDYVVLVPGHIKPTILKLWIAVHELDMKPSVKMVDFMLQNLVGEVHEDTIFLPDVDLVKSVVFSQ